MYNHECTLKHINSISLIYFIYDLFGARVFFYYVTILNLGPTSYCGHYIVISCDVFL
jgi:hypothetical protein